MKSFLQFVRTWREEIVGIPLALVLFFFSAEMLRFMDPSAGTYDAGVLQIIFLIHVKGMFMMLFSWLAIRFTFPSVWRFFQDQFETAFLQLSPWERIRTSLYLLFGYFFALVLLGLSL